MGLIIKIKAKNYFIEFDNMSPPKASAQTSKEKMKQMRLPFAPIQKDNAISKQKEEQAKEIEKAAEEKQKKIEAERIAKEEELRLWAEEEAKRQRNEENTMNKENNYDVSQSCFEELKEKKRKLSDSAERNEEFSKKANKVENDSCTEDNVVKELQEKDIGTHKIDNIEKERLKKRERTRKRKAQEGKTEKRKG